MSVFAKCKQAAQAVSAEFMFFFFFVRLFGFSYEKWFGFGATVRVCDWYHMCVCVCVGTSSVLSDFVELEKKQRGVSTMY